MGRFNKPLDIAQNGLYIIIATTPGEYTMTKAQNEFCKALADRPLDLKIIPSNRFGEALDTLTQFKLYCAANRILAANGFVIIDPELEPVSEKRLRKCGLTIAEPVLDPDDADDYTPIDPDLLGSHSQFLPIAGRP